MTIEKSNIRTPVHTGAVNGHSVRFFKTPLDDGRPDLPWHAVDDLMKACGLTRPAERTHFLRMAQKDWGDCIRTVATASGPVTVGPHYMAQGLVGAMIHVRRVKKRAEMDYTKAAASALEALTGDLGDEASIGYAIAASHRWNDSAGRD